MVYDFLKFFTGHLAKLNIGQDKLSYIRDPWLCYMDHRNCMKAPLRLTKNIVETLSGDTYCCYSFKSPNKTHQMSFNIFIAINYTNKTHVSCYPFHHQILDLFNSHIIL